MCSGLFADESGLGYWDAHSNYVMDDYEYSIKVLHPDLVKYYNLRSEVGSFRVMDLPEALQLEIIGEITYDEHRINALSLINDRFIYRSDVNRILAAVIRSGAIFNTEIEGADSNDHWLC